MDQAGRKGSIYVLLFSVAPCLRGAKVLFSVGALSRRVSGGNIGAEPGMIPCRRDLFEIPDGVTYLNCAYMSPMMRSVADEGRIGLERKMHPWKVRPADFFSQSEELRGCASRFFLCSPDDVAIVPSASYGIQMAAANLPLAPGKKVLVLEEQFPSNFYAWRRLAEKNGGALLTVALPEDGDWTAAVLRSMTDEVGIAALPQVQWTTGGLLDLT